MIRAGLLVLAAVMVAGLPAAAQSRKGELRGAWMGEGYGRDWPAIMKSLEANGFNALFPNMCTGGAAFYPSKVLPVAPGAPAGRDDMAEAVKAAKQCHIEVQVWRINWVLFHCPPEVLAGYEKDGRLMRNAEGKLAREDPTISSDFMVDWLCPSQPDNRKLEKEAMLELVRNYDIAGIHFDYMRYPKPDYCYCNHCRGEFEKAIGRKVESWPQEVTEGGALAERYADWRRGLQTSLVSEISREAHRIKPGVLVSLAAWPEVSVARNWVLQDWPAWVQSGALDFICFMDYNLDQTQLAEWLASHRKLIRGQIPVYAGLGAFLMRDAATLIDQIRLAREEGADGFLAFAYYSGDLDKWLPELRASVTAGDPNPMPHAGPPAVFAFSGPATAKPAGGEQVLAGEQLHAEVTIGTPPPEVADEQDTSGAEQAAAVLRQTTQTRKPTQTYEPVPHAFPGLEGAPRLSGRIVVETPNGERLVPIGVFDSDLGIKRKVKFTVPESRFRVAAYGTESSDGRESAFVVRGPLLIGVKAEELTVVVPPPAPQGEVEVLLAGVASKLNESDLSGLGGCLRINLTGDRGGEWWLLIREGKCEWGRGMVEAATATVSSSVNDALAVAGGEADAYALWNAGRITVTGDTFYVERIADVLGIDTGP